MTDIEHTLFGTLKNFSVTARLEAPSKSPIENDDDDAFSRYGDGLVETFDVRINNIDEDSFQAAVKLKAKDFFTSIYSEINKCTNRPEAVGVYNTSIRLITNELQNLSAFLKDVDDGMDNFRAIKFDDNGIEEGANPFYIERETRKIYKHIYSFFEYTLKDVLNTLEREKTTISNSRLMDYKLTIKSHLPSFKSPKFQKGASSYIINTEHLRGKTSLKYKLSHFRDKLISEGLIDSNEEGTDTFMNIFLNKPIVKKITLTEKCTKALLITLLADRKKNKILTNKDYLKISSECFIFSKDMEYNWEEKFRKTSKCKAPKDLKFVEECRNIFI